MQIDEAQVQKMLQMGSTLKEKPPQGEQLKKAAAQFEQFMVSYAYKNMYSGIEKSEFSGGSMGQDVFMGMFIDEAVKQSGGGPGKRGIADLIVKQYSNQPMVDRKAGTIAAIDGTRARPDMDVTDALNALASGDASEEALLGELSALSAHLEDKVSSGFGMRKHPILKVSRFHDGVDYALPLGEPLRAPAAGKVVFAGKRGGYGNAITIDHGHGFETRYAHLSEVAVKEGDFIGKNEFLGKVGSTGMSTGPHLHFEVRKRGEAVDPRRLLSDRQDQKTAQGL